MFRSFILASVSGLALLTTGCASLPDATVRYYLPQTKLGVRVIRTVACDANNQLVLSNVVNPVDVHIADPNEFQQVTLKGLKGTFSDSDVKFGFYEDGRLKDFNSTSTGQGESILKTAITIGAAVFGLDGGSKVVTNECAEIKKAGDGKPLTITYGDKIDLTQLGVLQPVVADLTSQHYATQFEPVIGDVCAIIELPAPPKVPVTAVKSAVMLHLREPANVHLKVFAGVACGKQSPAWDGDVLVAQLGTFYDLPIPAPVLFGKEFMGASFAESGALTSVQFTSNTGAGQLLNVASAAQTAAKPETATQKAADLKAEADQIAQQQRLVQCIADPKNCK